MTIADIKKYQFINTLKHLPFIEKIILFGSRARKDNQPKSDIDIAIVSPTANVIQWEQVLNIIENADTLLPIDCIRFEQAGSSLQKKILKEGIEL